MTVFETVKNSVTPLQAAERYGLKVERGGMCQCPFHNDRNPSMKLYEKRFHCFGCQADGDVIDFTSRFFNLSLKDAAMKLAADFSLQYDARQAVPEARQRREISEQEILNHQVSYCFQELTAYRYQLIQWQQEYAPALPSEAPHPRFLEAVQNLDRIEYSLDVLQSDRDEEKRQVVAETLRRIEEHKEEPSMEPEDKTPVYHQSASYAREHDELEQFRQSHWANVACKKDIEKAITAHFDGLRLDKRAVDEVIARYGPERISLVLAATVQVKAWDGRFSSANKDWAFTFDFPEAKNDMGFDRRDDYAVTSHPAILDGFINRARQEIQQMEQGKKRLKQSRQIVRLSKPGSTKPTT